MLFPEQQQQPPGLTGKLDPRPDHGEQSYTGSGKLAGKVALITGADSGIGKAVAIAYAREGADVVIGYLSETEDAATPDSGDCDCVDGVEVAVEGETETPNPTASAAAANPTVDSVASARARLGAPLVMSAGPRIAVRTMQ